MGKLTARMVASLSEKGRYHDGDNLVLQVGPTGNKSWLFCFMLNGRSRQMGLGSAELLSLQEARDKAFILRRRLKLDGVDPIEERKTGRARPVVPSFRVFADEWITAQEPGWRNDKHKAQWRSSLRAYALPVIGDLPVDVIATDHVMKIVEPIWATKPETADRVRARIAKILDAAKARKFRTGDNPAQWRGALKHLLPAQAIRHPPLREPKALAEPKYAGRFRGYVPPDLNSSPKSIFLEDPPPPRTKLLILLVYLT